MIDNAQELRIMLASTFTELSAEQQDKLINFIALLGKWNRAYNLTAIRDPKDMLIRHVFDSLATVPHLHGDKIIDVGTGPGIPGIPLAIACPSRHFVLLDSNGKKIRFVRQAIAELGLKNVTAYQHRVESFDEVGDFDSVLTRAFSDLPDIYAKTKHLLAENGMILAMKGKIPKEELKNFSSRVTVLTLKVPYLDEQRHLLCITGR